MLVPGSFNFTSQGCWFSVAGEADEKPTHYSTNRHGEGLWVVPTPEAHISLGRQIRGTGDWSVRGLSKVAAKRKAAKIDADGGRL